MGAASILAGAAAAGASSANAMAGASISAEPRPMAARIFNIESPSFVRPQIQNDSRLSHLWQIQDELWMNVCLTCGATAILVAAGRAEGPTCSSCTAPPKSAAPARRGAASGAYG